ncbi:MAG TPA: NAD(P)H-hydrate dehydratase [Phycisphaerales bacterium]|nr:NAD(P)H-hydrate dehydratase [Phycisphaerales bacterium]
MTRPDDLAASSPLPCLPPRDPAGHKGVFGTVAVVGGCASGGRRMIGAPALAALGALRGGVGLVRLITPRPVLNAALVIAPSATGVALPVDADGAIIAHEAAAVLDGVLADADCLVIGPGFGMDDGARAIALRAVQQDTTPVVVDADAINGLSQVPELWRDFRAPTVLTPHPGEFRRMAGPLRIAADPTTQDGRIAGAERMAQRLGCIVVLKGAGTVVSDGHRSWVCERGHACLATAGTGDVLAGLIGAIVAQFVPRPDPTVSALPESLRAKISPDPRRPLSLFEAARIGVQAHAIAGERWADSHGAEAGLLAAELADLLPKALSSLRSR